MEKCARQDFLWAESPVIFRVTVKIRSRRPRISLVKHPYFTLREWGSWRNYGSCSRPPESTCWTVLRLFSWLCDDGDYIIKKWRGLPHWLPSSKERYFPLGGALGVVLLQERTHAHTTWRAKRCAVRCGRWSGWSLCINGSCCAKTPPHSVLVLSAPPISWAATWPPQTTTITITTLMMVSTLIS